MAVSHVVTLDMGVSFFLTLALCGFLVAQNGGTVTVENGSHKVTSSGQYHAFAHYTRHVKRGAKLLSTGDAKADEKALSHVAFRNPDGGNVLVVANPGPEKTIQVTAGGQCLEFKAPSDSVHTLEWS